MVGKRSDTDDCLEHEKARNIRREYLRRPARTILVAPGKTRDNAFDARMCHVPRCFRSL